jgi:hypothetical protein
MTTFENPFSIDRAEQLGDNLFEFFAYHKSFQGLFKFKSLIIEGGRGSGKTMFYLYHSYYNKRNEAKSKNISFVDFIQNENLIGIHFRADSNFVPAFQKKGIDYDEWVQLFSHYLNITLSKRLIEVVLDINNSLQQKDKHLRIEFKDYQIIQTLLGYDSLIDNLQQLLKVLTNAEVELISFINNTSRVQRPILIANGYLLNLIAKLVLDTPILNNKALHIFVDEYENLLPYQQKIINTLIKHPNPVIFDIGMRKEGLKTYQTLSESEIISFPHDFDHFDFEQLSDSEYEELIVQICEKRLAKMTSLDNTNNNLHLDIRYYLGSYNADEEVQNVSNLKYTNDLKIKIKNKTGESEDFKILYESDDPLILRLNLVLIERNQNVKDLSEELKKYHQNVRSKYSDWIHNNKMGIVFLICKENSKQKTYSGFNTYKSVSSGIIRFFIELCESAFKNAYRNGFSFEKPRPISTLEQTEAAYYVSKYKVNDIETYTPNSIRLKRFVMLLGKIFNALHYDSRLSEPERNHFHTQYDKLTDETRSFINNAVLYSVLQKREVTKEKSSAISPNNSEFHLNHIYSPYFQISARRKRSVYFDAFSLESLVSSDTSKATSIANKYVKDNLQDDTNQIKIDF